MLQGIDICSFVTVAIPKVDRALLDMKFIRGKVVDFRNGVYMIGTTISDHVDVITCVPSHPISIIRFDLKEQNK